MADVITVDLRHPNLSHTVSRPFRNFVPNLAYSASGAEVDNVFINGRRVMDNGRLLLVDESALTSEAEADWRRSGSMLVRHTDEGRL